MRILLSTLAVCFAITLGACTKKEAPPADSPDAAAEQVEGTSSAPSDATPENSPEEMQKKDNSNKSEE